MKKKILLFVICYLFMTTSASASFFLGGTRLIYDANVGQGASIKIGNQEEGVDYLIQSWVESPNPTWQDKAIFAVNPSEFKLSENRDSIITVTFSQNATLLPKDRETMFWLNIKVMPVSQIETEQKLTDIDKYNKRQKITRENPDFNKKKNRQYLLAFKNRVKLFYRPIGVAGNADTAYQEVKFIKEGNSLIVHNPTGYYITFASIKSGYKELLKNPMMLEPMHKTVMPLTTSVGDEISWQAVDDRGKLTIQTSMSLSSI